MKDYRFVLVDRHLVVRRKIWDHCSLYCRTSVCWQGGWGEKNRSGATSAMCTVGQRMTCGGTSWPTRGRSLLFANTAPIVQPASITWRSTWETFMGYQWSCCGPIVQTSQILTIDRQRGSPLGEAGLRGVRARASAIPKGLGMHGVPSRQLLVGCKCDTNKQDDARIYVIGWYEVAVCKTLEEDFILVLVVIWLPQRVSGP